MPQRKIRNNDLSETVLRSKLMPCNVDARTISCTILALQVHEQASILNSQRHMTDFAKNKKAAEAIVKR